MNINDAGLTSSPDRLPELVRDTEHLKKLVALWADNTLVHHLAVALLAVREAQPVADEIYAELYRLRIENKGPDGFETWKDAAIFERGRRIGAERKIGGEEMTYLEAMALLTKEEAQNLSAIEAFRRGASYSGKINAHALRDSMRYQFLRDKDAFGAENEPGLAGWGELIDLDGNEFDAAIDARMAHPDIAYTAPNAPAVPEDVAAALDWIDDFIARCNGDDRGACNSVNVLRAAMPQPVSQGYTLPAGFKLVPVESTDAWTERYCELTNKHPDGGLTTYIGDGAVTITFREKSKREIDAMLAAAPTPTKAVNDAQKK